MSDPYVLVIGMSCLDMQGRSTRPYMRGASIPGAIRTSVGGVARNVAENLVRLGVCTKLLSAVGDDPSGRRIMAQAENIGIDVDQVMVVPAATTGKYIALLDKSGDIAYALDDMRIASSIRPDYISRNQQLISEATMIVLDANLSPPSLKKIFQLARKYKIDVCADPTSTALARRFVPYLRDLLLITPNILEAEVLCKRKIARGDDSASLEAAKCLVSQGVDIAVITMAEKGLCYATNEESGHVPALVTDVTDLTGGGDALTAAIVFSLLNEIPVSEAMRLGCSAASLTIASDQTVAPELTLEVLYDNLSV
ncbi:MAG: carbohydrate kinase family protein [Anaerolineales bacterium]|nr:carbohydrate kinase family protein [Anaerolineales bacterium]